MEDNIYNNDVNTDDTAGDVQENLPPEGSSQDMIGPVVLGVIAVLVVALIIVFVVRMNSDKEEAASQTVQTTAGISKVGTSIQLEISDNDESADAATEETIALPETTDEEVTLQHMTSVVSELSRDFLDTESCAGIQELIEKYFDAYSACSASDLMSLVDYNGGTPVTTDELSERAEIIEDYEDVECSVIQGMDEETYVVYVSYNIKFYNIDTPAPTLTRFYVITDSSGSYRIYNGSVSSKLSAFLNDVSGYDCVKELSEAVDASFEKACESDERLTGLMEILN